MTGFTFKVPERFKDYTGQYHGADKGETDFNSNVFYTNLIYLPRTDEERAAILAYRDGLTESEMETDEFRQRVDEYYKFNLSTVTILAIKNDMDFETELNRLVVDKSKVKKTGELGTAGDYNYYYIIPDYSEYDEMFREGMPEEMYAEYQDAMANAEADVLSGVTLKGARRAFEVTPVGTKLSFETTDVYGNAVSSADLFAEKGVTYTNVKQTDELAKTLLTISMPTTYFVDSEGRVLTTPVKGANFDKYREKLEEALKTVE